jgi:malic enzyme
MPDLAKQSGAYIVATGRSDFPNQVNNALVFPGYSKPHYLSMGANLLMKSLLIVHTH